MWSDWLGFCDYGFSVFALWCPLATPTILLGFLLPWTWDISSRLLQQSTATAPYLGRGVSPYCHRSWPSTWDSSSRPSCACAATAPQKKWSSHHSQQKSPKCSTWMQSQKRQNDLCSSPRQTIQYQLSKSRPQPVMLKKLKLNGFMKTYKTF